MHVNAINNKGTTRGAYFSILEAVRKYFVGGGGVGFGGITALTGSGVGDKVALLGSIWIRAEFVPPGGEALFPVVTWLFFSTSISSFFGGSGFLVSFSKDTKQSSREMLQSTEL